MTHARPIDAKPDLGGAASHAFLARRAMRKSRYSSPVMRPTSNDVARSCRHSTVETSSSRDGGFLAGGLPIRLL